MSWLSRFFPVRSLDRVGSGARCILPVTVVSPNVLESTVAPTRGAAIRWALLYEVTGTPQNAGGARTRTLHAFASGWRGGPIVTRAACGRTIEVALDHARLSAPVDPEDGVALGESPAAVRAYGELASRTPTGAGLVYVREHVITSGQRLVLRGKIEPRAAAGGYREAAPTQVPFRAIGDLTIEDRALG
jgi:hypothetical protein